MTAKTSKGLSIAERRLVAQRLVGSELDSPVAAARHLLAVQGQDLGGGKWALGARVPGATLADVDAALEARAIVRSWPMRGTLHLLAAEDLKWMLALGTPGVLAATARRRGELGLDPKTLDKARDVVERTLAGGKRLGRAELSDAMVRAKLGTDDPHRAYHMFFYLAQIGCLVMGPPDGAELSFVLVDEWIREHRSYARDEALGELARRYFLGHGPATLADLVRWVKLPQRELKIGVELAKPALEAIVHDGQTYYQSPELAARCAQLGAAKAKAGLLLPGFDEIILGYTDRTATIDKAHEPLVVPGGNGVFLATAVVGARAVATWKKTAKANEVVVELRPFAAGAKSTTGSKSLQKSLAAAASAYARFLGKPVRIA